MGTYANPRAHLGARPLTADGPDRVYELGLALERLSRLGAFLEVFLGAFLGVFRREKLAIYGRCVSDQREGE